MTPTPEELQAQLDKAQEDLEKAEGERDAERTRAEKAEGEVETLKAEAGKPAETSPADLNKDELPEPVRAALAKAEEREQAALAKAEEAVQLAKDEQNRRVTAEFIAKAETGDLRGIPGSPAEVGPLLKALQEAAPEAYAALEKSVLTPAAAQLQQSDLLKQFGAGGEGPPPESSLAKMDAAVAELRKADPQLTRTQAMERARELNPDLAKAVAADMRGVQLQDSRAWGRP